MEHLSDMEYWKRRGNAEMVNDITAAICEALDRQVEAIDRQTRVHAALGDALVRAILLGKGPDVETQMIRLVLGERLAELLGSEDEEES